MDEMETRIRLIRLAADGELTAAEVSAFESQLAAFPQDRLSVESERQLREAVRRIMVNEVSMPGDLRERIAAAWEGYEECVSGVSDFGANNNERIGESIAMQRRRWFIPSGLAAGIIVLVGGSILIGVWANRIGGPRSAGELTASDRAAMEIYQKTQKSLGHSLENANWLAETIDSSEAKLAQEFGAARGYVPRLREVGFAYRGLRVDSEIPGSRSLTYSDVDDDSNLAVLWVTRRRNIDSRLVETMKAGVGYRLTSGPIPNGGSEPLNGCFAWVDSEVIYIAQLDHSKIGEEKAEEMARALGMPDGPIVTYP